MSKREFSEYIGFINKDEFLTKSHIKYLESRLVEMAKEAKSAEIENSTTPSLPMLPEPDIADMEFYLEQIKLILPLMGFNFLIPSVVIPSTNNKETSVTQKGGMIYTIKSSNLNANMVETDDGYIVLKGSEAKSSAGALSVASTKRREKLILDQTLVSKGNILIFMQDAIFTSVSTAATMILAREANGRIEWVDQNGRTYKKNAKEI